MQYVFGLDIGTRSIVGSVGYLNNNKFNVVAHYMKEHETRAMLDGQIHDISKVGETILQVKNELEKQINHPLSEVCIAAAGRVLKTATSHVEYSFDDTKLISAEDIYILDLLGIEEAHNKIRKRNKKNTFLSVGYSVVKYYLNDIPIGNLEGHKGRKISADVLATFLPDEVIDSLYASIEYAGLSVANLTLEPIAAINIAIPERFRLLNIALVDVGAGTSDISVTRDGSIVAYGMIPSAGDEITEAVMQKYLLEFNEAEKAKISASTQDEVVIHDIIGLEQKISSNEIKEAYNHTVEKISSAIAKKIIQLNGGKNVSAVFLVGGGGKANGFIEKLAEHLNIQKERVALRGEEVLSNVDFKQENIVKDPLLVTPIGICLNWYDQKNSFVFVNINDVRVKLYNNNRLTVADATIQIGLLNEDLFPKSGKELNFQVNGKQRFVRGDYGEPAKITINGEPAHINSPIRKNDQIRVESSTPGVLGHMKIEELQEYKDKINLIINDKKLSLPKIVLVNNKLEAGYYSIQENDDIRFKNYYTTEQLLEYMDLAFNEKIIFINDEEASPETKIYEDFIVQIQDVQESFIPEQKEEETIVDNEKIVVVVNDSPVTLDGKAGYSFVDVFDKINFDLSKPQGRILKTTINGKDCGYMDPLNEGDVIVIQWLD